MPQPIYEKEIERALARLQLGAVNPRHVEAWLWEVSKGATVTLGQLATEGGDRFDKFVANAAALVNAVPYRESETLAQKWHL